MSKTCQTLCQIIKHINLPLCQKYVKIIDGLISKCMSIPILLSKLCLIIKTGVPCVIYYAELPIIFFVPVPYYGNIKPEKHLLFL